MANKPVRKIKVFPLTAAIWRNEGKDNHVWYSVTLERSYRGADGEYGNTGSLNKDDLLLAGKVLDRAHTEVLRLESADYEAGKKGGKAAPAAAGEPDDVPF